MKINTLQPSYSTLKIFSSITIYCLICGIYSQPFFLLVSTRYNIFQTPFTLIS